MARKNNSPQFLLASTPHPLTDDQCNTLLVVHETVRDPVQHDIAITALERCLIDTATFQRLRLLKQLGPTHLVYPGAVHTRFMHSLGTVQAAERLVETANRNYHAYKHEHLVEVTPFPHLLIRLTALLHDVAHIPYGHTLEDEGNLTFPEWEDKDRVEHWLGDDSEIAKTLADFLEQHHIDRSAANSLLGDIRRYLVHNDDLFALPYPYVADFVGNTICADLLDYLPRDMYFCGLTERSGDRAMRYMAVVNVDSRDATATDAEYKPTAGRTGKGRVALLTYRLEADHTGDGSGSREVPQPELLSEVIDLLRRRFALAEKVFFHRTKLAASAMLISAVGASSVKTKDLYEASDESLLERLLADNSERARRLALAYRGRRLYKPAFRINYRQETDTDPTTKRLWRDIYSTYRNPESRREVEERLETYANLAPGSVAIYCPDKKMNIKAFKMLVQGRPGGEVKRLENILDANRTLEMEALNRPYPHLWRMFVFVDPSELDMTQLNAPRVHDFNGLCESIFDCSNGIDALHGTGRRLEDQIAGRVIEEYEAEEGGYVPYSLFGELLASARRAPKQDLLGLFRAHVRAAMEDRLRLTSDSDGSPDRP